VSAGAYVIGLSMLVFLVNLIWSMLIKREPLEGDPWGSKSLEWELPTPVPVHDFDRFPAFDDDPYPYGVEPGESPALAPAGGE
jgi:cytochrome c oxidase subunit 1